MLFTSPSYLNTRQAFRRNNLQNSNWRIRRS